MSQAHAIRRVRAFTLIEVMIAVLILALGLLGLGAIIPVIIYEQRRASESTLGVAAAHAAEAYFQSRADFNVAGVSAFDRWFDAGTRGDRRPAWSYVGVPSGNTIDATSAYLWEPLRPSSNTPLATPNELSTTTGDLTLWAPSAPGVFDIPCTISVGDRLWPSRATQPTSTAGGDPYRPVFVWDFVGRRLPSAAGALPWPSTEPQSIQLAVFVRRIDSGVRIPRGQKLVDVLTGNVPVADRRLPVAIDSQLRPTNNGVGTYSAPVILNARILTTGARNRIQLIGANPTLTAQVSQPGQRIVDNLGNVYTVGGIEEGTVDILLVDPPVSRSIAANPASLNSLRQIVYTPQIPAAVHVFTLGRPAR